MIWLSFLVWSSVCEYLIVLIFVFIFFNVVNICQNFDLNLVFLSDIIFVDTSWFAIICCSNRYATFSVLIFSWNDMKYVLFVNLFTTIMIELYLNLIVDFLNFDSLTIKFTVTDYHDLLNASNNCSFSYDLCCLDLLFWHCSHCWICFFTFCLICEK